MGCQLSPSEKKDMKAFLLGLVSKPSLRMVEQQEKKSLIIYVLVKWPYMLWLNSLPIDELGNWCLGER